MIAPSQTTIDVTSLPAVVQSLVATLDTLLQTWTVGEIVPGKLATLPYANIGGYSAAKEAGLKLLAQAYEARGWHVVRLSPDGDQVSFRLSFSFV